MKKLVFITLLSTICFVSISFISKSKPPFTIKTVVIDAGHGGKDPGCHGIKYKEKDVALAVALKLGKYIEDNMKDVRVVYTRKTDVFVELQERAEIANRAKADLFICIHCNSACVHDKKLKKDVCRTHVNGAETYVMGIKNEKGKLDVAKRENSSILLEDNYLKRYQGFDPNSDESYIIMNMWNDVYLNQSISFAAKAQKEYASKAGRADHGVKRASLWVLWRTYMPSVLTEIGYLTNPAEEQFLGSTKGQDYIASGLFRAFRDYKDGLEGTTKKYDDDFEKQTAYKPTKSDSVEIENLAKQTPPDIIDTTTVTPVIEEKEIVKDSSKANTPTEIVSAKKEDDPAESTIVYKVQLFTADKKVSLQSDKLKDIENLDMYMENGVYKYTAGEFQNIKDASNLQYELRKQGFPDCFIIAMKDGKRISIK